jgi:hypothetical protein
MDLVSLYASIPQPLMKEICLSGFSCPFPTLYRNKNWAWHYLPSLLTLGVLSQGIKVGAVQNMLDDVVKLYRTRLIAYQANQGL